MKLFITTELAFIISDLIVSQLYSLSRKLS